MLELDRIVAKMDEVGVDRIALIPTMNDVLPETPDRLLAAMRVLMRRKATRGVAEAVHRALLTPGGNLRLEGKVYEIYPRPDNASVAEVLRAHPDRFLGWIFLNPRRDPSVLSELERWRALPGFVGVKLHPHWHDYTTDRLDPILRRCEELGMPVLIHLGFRARGDFRHMATRYPKLTIISAHAGFPFFDDLWVHAADLPNLFVDLSSPYISERLARACVAAMGPERCLYGTDAPYGFHADDGSYDYGEIRGWVERLPIPATKIEEVLGGTFARLVDI